VELIESSGGRFEVGVNGALIFQKSKLKRHPAPGEIVTLMSELL
jgi:predicted Rdx family selenoprotein